jgi:histidinol-phosphate aminotransferase
VKSLRRRLIIQFINFWLIQKTAKWLIISYERWFMKHDTLLGLARKEVRGLSSYNAGLSIETVRARYGVDRIAKLGSNENHFGPSSAAIKAMQLEATKAGLYPDPNCSELRAVLAKSLSIPEDKLIFGNGSEDLLGVISRVFLDHGDQVVTVLPSFGLHIIYPQAVGAEVIAVPMGENMRIDIDRLTAALSPRTRLLMFSCPSNPVGSALQEAELARVLEVMSDNTLLVFDEAYYEYAQMDSRYPDCLRMLQNSGKPFILLRTFSKAYGLAGARVGYGITSDATLSNLVDRLRTPFNLNRAAQAGALAAWSDEDHLMKGLRHVVSERARLSSELVSLGIKSIDSFANFLFFKTPHQAEVVNERLLSKGVIVKPWKENGYTDWLRVSIGSSEDCNMFISALKVSLSEI